jgi:hypothetical protein
LVVVAKGLSLLAVPLVLSPDYSFEAIPLVDTALDPRVLGTAVLFAALGYGLWRLDGKRRMLGLLGGWYALAILPTSNLLVTVGTIFGERLLYLPSVAFCLLAALGAWGLHSRWPRAVPVVIVGLCVAWAGQTLRYTQAWKNDLTLFGWAVSAVPQSTKAHHKLGEEQLRAGSLGDAVRSLKRSLAIAPDNRFASITLSQAIAAIEDRFLPLPTPLPGDPDVLYVLGQAVQRTGESSGAETLWQETLVANPDHAEALADLGALRIVEGDTLSGLRHLETAVRIRPEMAWPWVNLARIYLAQGDGPRARTALERFLEIDDPRLPAEVLWARGVLQALPSR